ncbi:hypothetical protein [Pantoea agglomerans]|nr:hypothetical protein [Pantoea agglomerans]WNK40741.1 hypothetical protein RM160_04830 [Pantoea agglomerans]
MRIAPDYIEEDMTPLSVFTALTNAFASSGRVEPAACIGKRWPHFR